eukprot:scaffold1068_cov375-Prasinococcus_capsulatus_cf.AAC.14
MARTPWLGRPPSRSAYAWSVNSTPCSTTVLPLLQWARSRAGTRLPRVVVYSACTPRPSARVLVALRPPVPCPRQARGGCSPRACTPRAALSRSGALSPAAVGLARRIPRGERWARRPLAERRLAGRLLGPSEWDTWPAAPSCLPHTSGQVVPTLSACAPRIGGLTVEGPPCQAALGRRLAIE